MIKLSLLYNVAIIYIRESWRHREVREWSFEGRGVKRVNTMHFRGVSSMCWKRKLHIENKLKTIFK